MPRAYMLELCALFALLGCVTSVGKRLGRGNPFGIFFGLWLCVTIGLIATRHTFYSVSSDVWQLLAIMLGTYLAFAITARGSDSLGANGAAEYREKYLRWAQWAVLASTPLLYLKATQLAGGDVLSRSGYIALRTALTVGTEGYGLLAYFVPLGCVVASIRVMQFAATRQGLHHMIISVGAAAVMAFLCTGRTFFLMLFCFCTFPLVVTGKLKPRGAILLGAMLVFSFLLVAMLTRKGLDFNATMTENVESLVRMLRVYVLAPTMAMAVVADTDHPLALGGYSLRFFQILLTKLAGISFDSPPLIREYVQIPDRVNVFTVMDPYYRDFGMAGVAIFASASAGLHWGLFRLMRRRGGAWIFIYSATLFPLVMQFFQDMYVTLLSTWVQVIFWYMLLVKQERRPAYAGAAARPLVSRWRAARSMPKLHG